MKNVLFVCTGNTCRSPMAECMLHALDADICAASAGIAANEGQPASIGARRAMMRRGLSLDRHRARQVTKALIDKADLVVGLSEGHAAMLKRLFPHANNIRFFDDPPVADPYGGSDEAYEQAACDIARQLPALITYMKEETGGRNE